MKIKCRNRRDFHKVHAIGSINLKQVYTTGIKMSLALVLAKYKSCILIYHRTPQGYPNKNWSDHWEGSWAVIRFFHLKGHNCKEIHAELVAVHDNNAPAHETVVKWADDFSTDKQAWTMKSGVADRCTMMNHKLQCKSRQWCSPTGGSLLNK